ncbi:hypothetical protein BDW68DRAFT_181258 [Aspergillus falconensis]
MSRRNYYAIHKGRVDQPTIFSSWVQVHPRVVGYNGAKHQCFDTLEDARNWVQGEGRNEFSEIVKSKLASKTSQRPRGKFYAIAYGRTTGVFEDYGEVEKAIKGFKSACYQRFDTPEEAKEFIDQWRAAYSEVWQREIKRRLHNGWLPRDLSFNTELILETDNENAEEDSA